MKGKNILFLTFWYPGSRNPVRGIFIREHALALKKHGCNVLVLAVNVEYGRLLFELKNHRFTEPDGLCVYMISIRSWLYKLIYVSNPLLNYLVYRFFRKEIYPNFVPDVIHSNVLHPAAIAGHYISVRTGKPHIITEHWGKIGKFFRRSLFSSLGKQAYWHAAYITTVSQWLKNELGSFVADHNKIIVVPNVVDSVFLPGGRTCDKTVNFTAVATWEPPKNINILVDALEALSQELTIPIRFNIVGMGSLLEPILRKREKYRFQVILHGYLSKSQIAAILQHTDLFLHCSWGETFSIVIAEALSCGVPVVASDVAAIPELISDYNGILSSNNLDAWVAAIRLAINKSYDRNRISEEASKRFSGESVAGQFAKLYSRC